MLIGSSFPLTNAGGTGLGQPGSTTRPYSTNTVLEIPTEPYPDWSRLVAAAWKAGWPPKEAVVKEHLDRATGAVKEALVRPSDRPLEVRPSSGVNCGRLTHYIKNEGRQRDNPMPDTIGATFAGGHFAHMIAQVGLESGLPACFRARFEVELPLPAPPWPEGMDGHCDLILEVVDAVEAAKFLDLGAVSRQIIGDFKGMEGFMLKAHANKDYEDKTTPDPFGYIAQLATYAHATETIAGGALLIGVDRGRPAAGITPRWVSGERLMAEWAAVNTRLTAKEDPGPEMLERYGKKAVGWYCGVGFKKGYCPCAGACQENRE